MGRATVMEGRGMDRLRSHIHTLPLKVIIKLKIVA